MQTAFSPAQLADPDVAESERILRACVHCGFCTATCPTYVLLGDELDSPRGRIYLIKNMLEADATPNAEVVGHVDRCLGCLACMTTCPSGVNYMHLADHGRRHIAQTYVRPLAERLLRRLLLFVLPSPGRFRLALVGAALARPFRGLLPGALRRLVEMAPGHLSSRSDVDRPQVFPAEGPRRLRVTLLSGCAQPVLRPAINEATVRLLTRHGVEVVIAAGAGCCGALAHHLGAEPAALSQVKANVAAWAAELAGGGLDAIVVNASGCGTVVKDYGFILRDDPAWAEKARTVSDLTLDVSELLARLDLEPRVETGGLSVAYHAACSLQHGQRVTVEPKALLERAGFEVRSVPEAHLCCGSAGTYNMLQPALADRLKTRKAANIESTDADLVAAGNIGCLEQIADGTNLPVVHTVELLDWATGGPKPTPLAALNATRGKAPAKSHA
ncbi:MAG: glycolate oxidase subunit GlcF [Alphaproteobacteria bacterium]|nr:glycolate oxidase subunit GlcF [Alphaproteobacteria bacterium]